MRMEKNTGRESGSLRWLTGSKYSAVSLEGSKHWLVTRSFGNGRLPLAVHLQLLQGVQQEEPGAISVLHGREIDIPKLSRWQLWIALALIAASWVALGQWISEGLQNSSDSIRLLLGGGLLSWLCLLFVDGLVFRTELAGNVQLFRLTATGPRSEPVCWLLTETRLAPWLSLTLPLVIALAGMSNYYPTRFGEGMTGAGLLLFAIRSCPLIHGPLSCLLGRARGVNDYPRYLRMAVATWWMPSKRSLLDRTKSTLAAGAAFMIAWLVGCIAGFSLFKSHSRSAQLVDLVWVRFWDGLFGMFALWVGYMLLKVARDAFRMRSHGRLSLMDPDAQVLRRWKESCAMLYHVPGLANAKWQWYRVEPGYPLIRYGQKESACWWIASGSLELIGRHETGAELAQGIVRGGSAFATGLINDSGPSDYDMITMEPTVVCKLEESQFRALTEDARKKVMSFIQISHAFDRCQALMGIHPVLKELWLAKGRLIWVPGGTVLMQSGEEATWVGLLVQGTLKVEDVNEEIHPDVMLGDEIFSHQTRRIHTIVTSDVVLLVRWENSWVQQWVPKDHASEEDSHHSGMVLQH